MKKIFLILSLVIFSGCKLGQSTDDGNISEKVDDVLSVGMTFKEVESSLNKIGYETDGVRFPSIHHYTTWAKLSEVLDLSLNFVRDNDAKADILESYRIETNEWRLQTN